MFKAKGPRAHSPEFKAQAVKRMRTGEGVSALANELKVRRKLLYDWKRAVEHGQPLRVRGRPKKQPADPNALAGEAAAQIAELEALVGRLTLQNHFFRGALRSIEELRQAKGASSSAARLRRSKR